MVFPVKVTVLTANYNGEAYLEESIRSVLAQRSDQFELEYIMIDGASKDDSMKILEAHRGDFAHLVSEPDTGPANALNKGLKMATGDLVGWINADDHLYPGAIDRAVEAFHAHPGKSFFFGKCPIVNEQNEEIRKGITGFKEAFFPISSLFTLQCINYVSQPGSFFTGKALAAAGLLREDMKAAWDYEFMLRIWRQGGGVCIPHPQASFRWHPGSISGSAFRTQFKEELEAAAADAGRLSPQALIHWFVRWGIVGSYSVMQALRR